MSWIMRLGAAVAAMAFVLFVTKATMRSEARYQAVTPARDIVTAFNDMAFVQHKPRQAVLKYMSPAIVDHDPDVTDGREGVIAHLEKLDWSGPGPQSEVRAIAADGPLVFVQHRLVRAPGTPPIAAVDIFRVENGQIVEHWDVMQSLPASPRNPKSMF